MKKSVMKRILCIIMSIVAACGIVVNASAAAVMPRYQRIYAADSSLTITTYGEATIHVRVSSNENDTLRGVIELKKSTSNGWKTVASWNVSDTRTLLVDYNRFVASGYTYKIVSSVDVFSTGGVYYETVNFESNAVYYG